MIDSLIYLLLAIAGLALASEFFRASKPGGDLGIDGKIIWVDRGQKTKPFIHKAFGIVGKPDLMYQRPTGVLAVEYKNRNGPIYFSDVIQAKSAALAARGSGHRVNQILIKTDLTERYINLPRSDRDLLGDIQDYLTLARQAKNNKPMIARTQRLKCKSCAFSSDCKYSMK